MVINMKICSHCHNKTNEITIDDSFDYAGTHCTHGRAGTWHDSHQASECCEADVVESDSEIWTCKCGHEMEISNESEIEWVTCPKCHLWGHWEINE